MCTRKPETGGKKKLNERCDAQNINFELQTPVVLSLGKFTSSCMDRWKENVLCYRCWQREKRFKMRILKE